MPWELKITRPDNLPLGDLQAVQDAVRKGVPSVKFYRSPSGLEKLSQSKVQLPDVLVRNGENAR